MDLSETIRSKEYQEISEKIKEWRERLGKANKKELSQIRDEKTALFAQLKKSHPSLYAAFRIDEKILGEMIYKKLTGKDIIID